MGEGPVRRFAQVLLRPLAWVYGGAAAWRRRRLTRQARSLSAVVISVGNITCGGTGKTPTAEWIARDLLRQGRKPAFLSRGYGRDPASGGGRGGELVRYLPPAPTAVGGETSQSPPRGVPVGANDEFRLLAFNLPQVPHFQGKDRYTAGLEAVALGAEVLILDDGFQHVKLARDLDIVLVDAVAPFGGGYVLPAGLLREPLEALALADLLVVTRSDQVAAKTLSALCSYLRARFPGIPQVRLALQPVAWTSGIGEERAPEAFRGRRVLAFCGIGNPEGFRRQLVSLGVDVVDLVCFRDHHRYTDADIESIRRRAKALGVDNVVMTQKDAVKVLPQPRASRQPSANSPPRADPSPVANQAVEEDRRSLPKRASVERAPPERAAVDRGERSRSDGTDDWWFLRVEQRVVSGEEEYRIALKRVLNARSEPLVEGTSAGS